MKKVKYISVILLFALFGTILGYMIPWINDNLDIHIQLFDFWLLIWIPLFVLLIIAIIFYQKGKTKIHQGIGNDDNFEDANKFLCLAGGCTNLSLPLYFITITLAFHNNTDDTSIYALLQLIFMFLFLGITFYLQKKIISYSKILLPEKKGDIFDLNFHKDWMSSMDEAELSQVYRSSYFSFKIMNQIYPILLVILFIMSSANIVSVSFPVTVGVLWCIQFSLYFGYAYQMEHGKRVKKI